MKYGHTTGHRRQVHQHSAWFAAIEAATLAAVEATWPATTPLPQEVLHTETPSDSMTTVSTLSLPMTPITQ